MPPRNWKDKPQTWEEQFAIHTKVWIKTQGSTNQLGKRQKKEKNESDFNRHLKKKIEEPIGVERCSLVMREMQIKTMISDSNWLKFKFVNIPGW